ncbi:hypothetical protein IJ425_04320 [bacterium]|nr:hypothetical protein [bacterium]
MKNYFYLFIVLIFLFLIFLAYNFFHFIYITAVFKELRPIHSKLPVYYKGILVGKAKELRHGDDFNHTLMRIMLFGRKLQLPSNTVVMLKKEKRNNVDIDFLELIYPSEPTKTYLGNHSKIEGLVARDVKEFLSNQHPDDLESIKQDLVESAQNLNYALSALGQIFDVATEILKENQSNIYKTTRNVENMTVKIDNAIKQKQLENTLSNLEDSVGNVSKITYSIDSSIPKVDNSLKELQQTACNINSITCGIRKTMSKNFSFLRLFFGKVIE